MMHYYIYFNCSLLSIYAKFVAPQDALEVMKVINTDWVTEWTLGMPS